MQLYGEGMRGTCHRNGGRRPRMAGVRETRDRISKLLMGSQNASQDMCDRCATGVRPCATECDRTKTHVWGEEQEY